MPSRCAVLIWEAITILEAESQARGLWTSLTHDRRRVSLGNLAQGLEEMQQG